jgi:hypothetical protein
MGRVPFTDAAGAAKLAEEPGKALLISGIQPQPKAYLEKIGRLVVRYGAGVPGYLTTGHFCFRSALINSSLAFTLLRTSSAGVSAIH